MMQVTERCSRPPTRDAKCQEEIARGAKIRFDWLDCGYKLCDWLRGQMGGWSRGGERGGERGLCHQSCLWGVLSGHCVHSHLEVRNPGSRERRTMCDIVLYHYLFKCLGKVKINVSWELMWFRYDISKESWYKKFSGDYWFSFLFL